MGTGISERAKTHSETTSLNNIIKGEQCKIDSQYKLIGKLYFEKYGDNAEDEFRQSIEIIKASNVKIAETENKIAEIKNRFNCPNCGTPFKNDAIFCSKCGTRLQPEQPPAESSQRVCAGCGSVLEEGAMFCTVCGAKAENAAEVPVNASEPAIEPVQPEADENNSVTENNQTNYRTKLRQMKFPKTLRMKRQKKMYIQKLPKPFHRKKPITLLPSQSRLCSVRTVAMKSMKMICSATTVEAN